MKKLIKLLVNNLKENNQDYEFYPTSKEMIKNIYDDIGEDRKSVDVLDIGAGNGNFKKWFNYFGEEKKIKCKYYVIEKSEILLNQLDKDTYVMGTDLYETSLIDKKVDIVFCNPPYSDFKNWIKKIILEGNFKKAYFVIPERWKEDDELLFLFKKYKFNILNTTDFLDAERQARAKVDIVCLKKGTNYYECEDDPFNTWFDEVFPMKKDDKKADYEKQNEKANELDNQISIKKNLVEVLEDSYEEEMKLLFNNFKSICSLDIDILNDIGIKKSNVKESLRKKISGLKIFYWTRIFRNIEQLTCRLTWDSREDMLCKFKENNVVDFNSKNIYAILIWCIKNANNYYNKQMISVYKKISCFENVKKYKSNKRTFEKEQWRWNQSNPSHYTLDYRLVSNRFSLNDSFCWNNETKINHENLFNVLNDFRVIANNLGFNVVESSLDKLQNCIFGEKYYLKYFNGIDFLEFKVFKNGNIHLKFNIEFMKAWNVEVARLLGWIKNKEEIIEEFEDGEDCEKYFKSNLSFSLNNTNKKIFIENNLKEFDKL